MHTGATNLRCHHHVDTAQRHQKKTRERVQPCNRIYPEVCMQVVVKVRRPGNLCRKVVRSLMCKNSRLALAMECGTVSGLISGGEKRQGYLQQLLQCMDACLQRLAAARAAKT